MKEFLYDLLKDELKPATGCTEPIAIAYAASLAKKELAEETITKISVSASVNIIKNAMGVTIPGTNLIGIEIAAALGAQVQPERKFELLKDLTEKNIKEALALVQDHKVNLEVSSSSKKLYIEIKIESETAYAIVVIEDEHDFITLIETNGQIKYKAEDHEAGHKYDLSGINLKEIWNFAQEADTDQLGIVKESIIMNKIIAEVGLKNHYGMNVGKNMYQPDKENMNSSNYPVALAAAASDARMSGSKNSAMSNSGSGNQGITATLPVIAFFETSDEKDEEKLVRAVTLSHLVSIYVKSKVGRLTPICGANIAGMGASAAISYLQGGKLKEYYASIQNMIGNVSGMICDGAKPGCAMKVATSVSAALMTSNLAMKGISIGSFEGIISDHVEKSIDNFSRVAIDGFSEADKTILDIMIRR
jgi:L-cysteine desulfidase